MRIIGAVVVCLLVSSMNVDSKPPLWFRKLRQEVKLLESDHKDLERIFNDATVISRYHSGSVEVVLYRTSFGRMEATYSGGDCEKYYDYRVRQGAIIEIVVLLPLETRPKFKKLQIDTTDFQTTREDDGTYLLVDPASGYSYSTQRKRLSSLLIEPPVSQNSRRCSTETELGDGSYKE
ncbi:MAG: hypothetical protein IPN69_22470 [Acidobacteria bacterium]|nr:hypothetical protein [Acidobacteriota bacterium]